MTLRPFMLAAGVAAAMALAAGAARADVIDGAWCHDARGRMVIDGPAITTPAGTQTQGDYARHSFSYVVPAGEPGAGATIHMWLLNEETVRLERGDAEETWHRCGPPVS